uniref:Secreted protein n=1 Tax=Ascaris lumbricoides TaxID=6252 RepID=A0A0M3HY22_ASCLU
MKCTRALNNSWSIVHPKLRRSRSVLARRVSRSLVLLHCVACPSSGVHCCSTTSESSSSSAMRGEWRSDARPPSTMVPRREGSVISAYLIFEWIRINALSGRINTKGNVCTRIDAFIRASGSTGSARTNNATPATLSAH